MRLSPDATCAAPSGPCVAVSMNRACRLRKELVRAAAMSTPIVTVAWSRDGGIVEEIENLLETDTAAKMQWNAFIDGKEAQEGERKPSLDGAARSSRNVAEAHA